MYVTSHLDNHELEQGLQYVAGLVVCHLLPWHSRHQWCDLLRHHLGCSHTHTHTRE